MAALSMARRHDNDRLHGELLEPWTGSRVRYFGGETIFLNSLHIVGLLGGGFCEGCKLRRPLGLGGKQNVTWKKASR